MAKELSQVRTQKYNSERALILPSVILCRVKGVSGAKQIRKRLTRRMDQWEAGMIAELVQDTVAAAKRGVGGAKPSVDDESIARRYHSMVIEGKL